MTEQFANAASTTLSGSITNSATSLVVASASAFPSSGNFRILVESEIMLVTGVSGTTFTVSRGQENTTAVGHNTGVSVTHILTAGALTQIKADLHGSGLSTSRPAATGSSTLYFCTDIPIVYYDNPLTTSWQQFASEYLPAGASASSYTIVGSISLIQLGSTVRAATLSNSSLSAVCLIPSTLSQTASWGVTLVFNLNFDQFVASGPILGVIVTNGTSSGTSVARALYPYQNSNGMGIEAAQFTLGASRTTLYSPGTQQTIAWINTGRVHLRLLADGSNLHYQVSSDGFHWVDHFTEATATNYTNYGFVLGTTFTGNSSWAQALIYENNLFTPTQYSITGATNASPSVITIGTHSIYPGDVVAIHGSLGNTSINTGTGNGSLAGGVIVTATTSTTITTTANGNGTWTSGGVVTLLSR